MDIWGTGSFYLSFLWTILDPWGDGDLKGDGGRGGQGSEVGGAAEGPELVSAQVVDQRLDVGEDTLGVGLVPHHHHVLHLQQRHAVGVGPGGRRQTVRGTGRTDTPSGRPGGQTHRQGDREDRQTVRRTGTD